MNAITSAAAALALAALVPAAAQAQSAAAFPSMTPKGRIVGQGQFPEQGGEAIYKGVCQGCHMPDGKGATGAATYPALAGDPRLAAPAFPVLRVLKGQGAMPPFRTALDDQQVADVVNYVRSSFGNSFKGKVMPAEVKALRGN